MQGKALTHKRNIVAAAWALERRLQPDSSEFPQKENGTRASIKVDNATEKGPGSANTAMALIGVAEHARKYLLDGFDHQMDLMERWHDLCDLSVASYSARAASLPNFRA
jgi:hypothetical protein